VPIGSLDPEAMSVWIFVDRIVRTTQHFDASRSTHHAGQRPQRSFEGAAGRMPAPRPACRPI
jgi:hypothetical protein